MCCHSGLCFWFWNCAESNILPTTAISIWRNDSAVPCSYELLGIVFPVCIIILRVGIKISVSAAYKLFFNVVLIYYNCTVIRIMYCIIVSIWELLLQLFRSNHGTIVWETCETVFHCVSWAFNSSVVPIEELVCVYSVTIQCIIIDVISIDVPDSLICFIIYYVNTSWSLYCLIIWSEITINQIVGSYDFNCIVGNFNMARTFKVFNNSTICHISNYYICCWNRNSSSGNWEKWGY